MSKETLREQYEKSVQFNKLAFIERPVMNSPGAPAQAMTNVSHTWSEFPSVLIAYEYTRWWKESNALRTTAMVGDWSGLERRIVRGPDASRFINYATVKDLSRQEVGQVVFTPMVNGEGKVALEGLTFRLSENEYMFSQVGAKVWFTYLQGFTGMDGECELMR